MILIFLISILLFKCAIKLAKINIKIYIFEINYIIKIIFLFLIKKLLKIADVKYLNSTNN